MRKKLFVKQLMRLKPEDQVEQMQAAQELVKKLKKGKEERMERFKKKDEEVKQMEKDEVKEILKRRAEDERKKKIEIDQRREQIKVRLDLMKEERERRQEDWQKLRIQNNTPQPLRAPLYIELEAKFQESLEKEEFEKRQRILEKIK